MPLLDIRNLSLELGRGPGAVRVLDGVSLSVEPGEIVCLVGESGCGKSVTALSVARLIPSPPAHYPGGEIRIEGRDVLTLPDRELRSLRGGRVSYVFQEPSSSLNPVLRIGLQLRETLRLHQPGRDGDAEAARLLHQVGIPDPERRLRDYPHQLSGGMQQRVMIAMALACRPKLLVADEPTTALDVTIQAQILALLRQLRRDLGMALLLITHDLRLVRELADRVAVMYAGEIVESGPVAEVLARPRHPYTRALTRSVPELGRTTSRLQSIPGVVPSPGRWPAGCRFAPRCDQARPDCHTRHPDLQPTAPGTDVRCPYAPA